MTRIYISILAVLFSVSLFAQTKTFAGADYSQGIVFVMENNRIVWKHKAPDSNDLWILPNGNILFTTGRGTPFGGPVPTLKIASNTEAYSHKQDWFDFNAGRILEGLSFEEATDAFLDEILRCASGEILSRCEEHGNREIMIFKDGVTL